MKCLKLFSGKYMKNTSKYRLVKFLPNMPSVKININNAVE